MIGHHSVPRAGRHSHENRRALACRRLDLEHRADQSGALGTLSVFYDLSQRFTIRAQTGDQTAVDLIYTFSYD